MPTSLPAPARADCPCASVSRVCSARPTLPHRAAQDHFHHPQHNLLPPPRLPLVQRSLPRPPTAATVAAFVVVNRRRRRRRRRHGRCQRPFIASRGAEPPPAAMPWRQQCRLGGPTSRRTVSGGGRGGRVREAERRRDPQARAGHGGGGGGGDGKGRGRGRGRLAGRRRLNGKFSKSVKLNLSFATCGACK